LGFLRDLPNLKYFHNLVQLITRDRYLTVEFKEEKHKESFLWAYRKTGTQGQNKGFVEVAVLGTETRESMFLRQKYTVYILEVRFSADNVKRIDPRFQTLIDVQKLVDPKKIKVNLPVLSKEVLKGNKRKIIEKRKFVIQEFLEKLLNCKETYLIPEIFKTLNLATNPNSNKTEEEIAIKLPSLQTIRVLIDVKHATISDLKVTISRNLGLVFNEEF
jgi:hypothetical protein